MESSHIEKIVYENIELRKNHKRSIKIIIRFSFVAFQLQRQPGATGALISVALIYLHSRNREIRRSLSRLPDSERIPMASLNIDT